jgi:uncharacterized protein YeaO (DUF488 family)
LVDRLWPRGLRKTSARLDGWIKDVAPSDALRKWFAHEPARWSEFKKRYTHELRGEEAVEQIDGLARRAKDQTVTLVYAARDAEHNNAAVLEQAIRRRLSRISRNRKA